MQTCSKYEALDVFGFKTTSLLKNLIFLATFHASNKTNFCVISMKGLKFYNMTCFKTLFSLLRDFNISYKTKNCLAILSAMKKLVLQHFIK